MFPGFFDFFILYGNTLQFYIYFLIFWVRRIFLILFGYFWFSFSTKTKRPFFFLSR